MSSIERLPVPIQTIHAELAERAWTGSFRETMDAGGSAHMKTVRGRKYWYWQSPSRNGARPPARYLGPDTPVLRRRIKERRGIADARKWSGPSGPEGCPALTP